MLPCNENIVSLVKCAGELMRIADEGDSWRDDDGCGVLYGVARDSAHKIVRQAEEEITRHKKRGIWDGPEQLAGHAQDS